MNTKKKHKILLYKYISLNVFTLLKRVQYKIAASLDFDFCQLFQAYDICSVYREFFISFHLFDCTIHIECVCFLTQSKIQIF